MRSELDPLNFGFSSLFLTSLSPQIRKRVYHQMLLVISGEKNIGRRVAKPQTSQKNSNLESPSSSLAIPTVSFCASSSFYILTHSLFLTRIVCIKSYRCSRHKASAEWNQVKVSKVNQKSLLGRDLRQKEGICSCSEGGVIYISTSDFPVRVLRTFCGTY